MNDDLWSVLLTMIKSWGLGIGAANARPSEPAAGLQVVRRPLLVKGQSADAGPSHGPRHYVDRPPTARQAAGGTARQRGPRTNRAPRGVDRHPSRLAQGQAIRPRKTMRLGSLIHRFLALRNRRMGPRLSGVQEGLPHQTPPPSRPRAHHAFGRGFAGSCQDGEAAKVEPP